mmetsp:Transcript_12194/g.28632  ORF Transcript_12194/g.28632 Transcript_12194/m.28632 type:complete len:510 (-) Transcript_12194:322-1851(-)
MADDTEFKPPFRKLYFSQDMVNKYEPLASALRKVTETEGKDDEVWEQYVEHLDKFNNKSWCSNWDGITYDIVFYGVSGYTGYLMTQYLKRVSLKRNPESFSFALAGRTRSKVQELRDREFAGTKHEDTPILQMSYDDIFSIIDLVKSARVIVNVAGPYMLTQGEVLIDACIDGGVHYCDISGEIPWTLRLLDLHEYAKKKEVYVVPSAAPVGGYPDIGVYLCAKKIREEFNEQLRQAICYTTAGGTSGGFSGGTLKTKAAMRDAPDEVRTKMSDPFALGGFIPDCDRWGMKSCKIEFGTGKVTASCRRKDLDANMAKISKDTRLGVVRGPYAYANFDTRTVRRSNMLFANLGNRPYGYELNFMEYAMLPSDAIQASQQTLGSSAGSAEKPTPESQGKAYKEGEGPPLDELEDSWTGYFLWATTADEESEGHEVKCCFIGRDSYFETARVAIETAMCLCFDRDKLPYAGGVLTATVACGDMLVERLSASGVEFKMGHWLPPAECAPPPLP